MGVSILTNPARISPICFIVSPLVRQLIVKLLPAKHVVNLFGQLFEHNVPWLSLPMKVANILTITLIPIVLVLGSVQLLVTEVYLGFEYNKASFPSDPNGFDRSQRIAYASDNFRYVRENQPLDVLATQRLGDKPLYNSRELEHMQDVQSVYLVAYRVWQVSLAVLVLIGLTKIRRLEIDIEFAKSLGYGGLMTVGIITVVGILAILAWQTWFVVFHQVFFAPGTWSFETSDTLIRLFPEKFWFDAALTISGLSLAGGLTLVIGSWLWRKLIYINQNRPNSSY
jgi:integral membrane protein (TIGR01906 family)